MNPTRAAMPGQIATKRTKPPFRADHVGSILRTAAIKEARLQKAAGKIDAAQLKAVEDAEIRKIIARQEEVGLQSVTDGEFRRAWWHYDFLSQLDGVEIRQVEGGIKFAGVTTKAEAPFVYGKLGSKSHPQIEHFKFVKENTKRTPKMTRSVAKKPKFATMPIRWSTKPKKFCANKATS